jgi:hypothetical protein
MEHTLPCFASVDAMELCETKTEGEGKESKTEKDSTEEWKTLTESLHVIDTLSIFYFRSAGNLLSDAEILVDNVLRPIFSPPPNEA